MEFKKPEEFGISEESYGGMFQNKASSSKPKGERCSVCYSEMVFKDRVNSWYCPKCKQFY